MTAEPNEAPCTRRQFARVVNSAAVLGWLCAVFPIALTFDPRAIFFIFVAAIIGLSRAFAACWLIASPILGYAMRRLLTWERAAVWGAACAGAIEVAGVAISRVRGYFHSLDDSHGYQLGGGKSVSNVDGILTSYGWWMQLQSSAYWIACGIGIALFIRFFIGPGSTAVVGR